MNKVFTRWFIAFALTVTGIWMASTYGIHTLVLENDSSKMSYVVMFLFCFGSFKMCGIANRTDVGLSVAGQKKKVKEAERDLALPQFLAKNCTRIGMFGTIVGLIFMFIGMGTEGSELISAIKTGLGAAFFSTASGLAANILLNIQIFIVAQALGVEDE